MMRLLFFFLIIIFSNLSYSDDNNQLLINKPTKIVNPFDIENLNGKKIKISDSKNKILVLNFWATWCPPCIKEIPDLQKLQGDFQNDVEVLFISVDANFKKTVPKFLKKNKFSGLKVFNDEKLLITKKFEVKIMPTTIVINKDFKEKFRVTGYVEWSSQKYRELIKSLL
tara:strand:- start:1576 stop:2082 length:507 start_codon:yes stop_codon:yes gene_type:complete